jgi:hypothetical protein
MHEEQYGYTYAEKTGGKYLFSPFGFIKLIALLVQVSYDLDLAHSE